MIYKAYSHDKEQNCFIEIASIGDGVLFCIEYPDDWQSNATIIISNDDFVSILKSIAVNNEVDGVKLTVTDEANNV
jgi:hypothetical protein